MFPIIMSHLSKSLEVRQYLLTLAVLSSYFQIFGLEYADGVGGLYDLVIQTFVRFTAKSCEAIISSTTVLYLLVRKNYKLLVVLHAIILGCSVHIVQFVGVVPINCHSFGTQPDMDSSDNLYHNCHTIFCSPHCTHYQCHCGLCWRLLCPNKFDAIMVRHT